MKTAVNILSLAFRVLVYLASFGWNVVLPIIGLKPHIDRSRAIALGLGLALVWTYWIALLAAR
jgi:hypothetical protein